MSALLCRTSTGTAGTSTNLSVAERARCQHQRAASRVVLNNTYDAYGGPNYQCQHQR